MRLLLALVLVCAVTACGPRPVRTPEEAVCDAQANDDPQVKLLIMKAAGSVQFLEDNQQQLREARSKAVRVCLEKRGVVRPGGVERQKPL